MQTKADYEAAICERLSQAQPVPSFREVSFADGTSPKLGECHQNVNRYVGENPGTSAVRGWVPYIDFQISIRLAAHSVVRGTDGKLFDITPFGNNSYRDELRFVPHLGDEQEFLSMGNEINCPCTQNDPAL